MALMRRKCQARLEPRDAFWLSPYMAETETDRKKRLAEQLRSNLRRRKAQGRESEQRVDEAEKPAAQR